MPVISLFEHQTRSYTELGWDAHDFRIERLERLNEACQAELFAIGRRELRAKQFVGVVRVGKTTLQVLPKIDCDPKGNADAVDDAAQFSAATASATRNLLYFLSYTHNLQIKEQDVTPLLAQKSDWFELLTRLLASDLHRLMTRGLEHSYVTVEDSLPVIRGRWQIGRQLVQHPHVRHFFDVAYDEFIADTPLNQVFRFACDRLLCHTMDSGNRMLLRDIIEWFSEVRRLRAVPESHLDQIVFTRLNGRFRPSFNLARLFLEHSTLQLAAGAKETFAFVFDMNRLFEEFVARFVQKYRNRVLPEKWHDAQLRIQSGSKNLHLASRLPNGPDVFRLVPDLLFSTGPTSHVLVLDTKYKQLDPADRRLGTSQEDAYQLLAYSVRLACPRALLLYPQTSGAASLRAQFQMQGNDSRLATATIDLHRQLNRPDDLIRELNDILTPLAAD